MPFVHSIAIQPGCFEGSSASSIRPFGLASASSVDFARPRLAGQVHSIKMGKLWCLSAFLLFGVLYSFCNVSARRLTSHDKQPPQFPAAYKVPFSAQKLHNDQNIHWLSLPCDPSQTLLSRPGRMGNQFKFQCQPC